MSLPKVPDGRTLDQLTQSELLDWVRAHHEAPTPDTMTPQQLVALTQGRPPTVSAPSDADTGTMSPTELVAFTRSRR